MAEVEAIDPDKLRVEVEDEHGLLADIDVASDGAKGVYILVEYSGAGKRASIEDMPGDDDALVLWFNQDPNREDFPGGGEATATVRVLGLGAYSLHCEQDMRYGAYAHIMPPECGPRSPATHARARTVYERKEKADAP